MLLAAGSLRDRRSLSFILMIKETRAQFGKSSLLLLSNETGVMSTQSKQMLRKTATCINCWPPSIFLKKSPQSSHLSFSDPQELFEGRQLSTFSADPHFQHSPASKCLRPRLQAVMIKTHHEADKATNKVTLLGGPGSPSWALLVLTGKKDFDLNYWLFCYTCINIELGM